MYSGSEMKDESEGIWLLPSLSQGGREEGAGVASYEAVEEQRVDALRLSIGADAGIEVRGAALDEEDDSAWVSGRLMAAGKNE
jgi:hypothetical protein